MMEKRYYFDTSIWLDYYLKRSKNGKSALAFILKIILEESIIIFSNFVEKELKHLGLTEREIHSFLKILKPKHLVRIQVKKIQVEEARKLAKQREVPFGDALHAVLARDQEAQLISRDWDFEKLKDISRSKKPEDLL